MGVYYNTSVKLILVIPEITEVVELPFHRDFTVSKLWNKNVVCSFF